LRPLIVITLGNKKTDNINWIITLPELLFEMIEASFRKQDLLKWLKIDKKI
jgi:hypothetical protein